MGESVSSDQENSFYENAKGLIQDAFGAVDCCEKEEQLREVYSLSKQFYKAKEAYVNSYHHVQQIEKKIKEIKTIWKLKTEAGS